MENINSVFKTYTAGPSIDAWDTTYLPPEEWAGSIFEDAMKTATMLPHVRRYDSPRKVTVPVKTRVAGSWLSTVAGDVRTSNETNYDATGIALDPVEYRTFTGIARKSLEEATWSVEADVRQRLANECALKLDTEIFTCLDSNGLSAGKYQAGGESLDGTTTGNAVDYGTAMTIDNVIDCIYNVRNTSYNFYIPNTAVVTAAMMKEIVKDSPLLSAAEKGDNEVGRTGVFVSWLGMNWIISGNIPQDSGSTDVGLVFDDRYYLLGNVPHEFELATSRRYETDEVEFFVKVKAAFHVGDPEAGAVLYT